MKTKNIYIEDLTFNSNGIASFTLLEEKGNSVQILIGRLAKEGDGLYTFEDISTTSQALEIISYVNLMDSRYIKKNTSYEQGVMDVRLRDLQYEWRKALKAMAQPEKPTSEAEVEVEDAPKTENPQPKKKVKSSDVKIEVKAPVETPKVGLEAVIFDTVKQAVESKETAEGVKQMINNYLDTHGIVPNKTHIVVERKGGQKTDVGSQHEKFETILRCLQAGTNICLVGPAGSGKTTAVSNASKALGLPFYSKSVSSHTGVHEFFGYQDANGKYVRTLFREAYENGGVFLLDEFDAGNPNVLASMNQATANGHCAFADGMITKHEDFIVVMAGNTFGHGATTEYVGRNQIDAATLDRFVFINFGYDEKFELELSSNRDWCKEVQAFRRKVAEKKIRAIISPRATFDGEKLLAVGLPKSEVLEMVIFKGMTEDERALIS